jgi:NTP pyrophosphatase (non-canonical NTP hydrolase)
MEIEDLQSELRAFTAERDWEQFHTIKNLILALTGEVGELAASVQWLESVDLDALNSDPKLRAAFNEEIADVFIYLLRLADVSQTNLIEVAKNKIEENAKRYTVEKSKGNARKQ